MPEINWILKKMDALSAAELYTILRVRSEVFVTEQHCVYLDADGKDAACHHLCGYAGDELAAYARLLPPGLSYAEASIGRVLTAMEYRKNGFGGALMKEAIKHVYALFNCDAIKIGAQLYLKKFYESMGFVQTNEPYLEDGIPHIEMRLSKKYY